MEKKREEDFANQEALRLSVNQCDIAAALNFFVIK